MSFWFPLLLVDFEQVGRGVLGGGIICSLLIKHETKIQTGEFGNPDIKVREERWTVSGARNNLLAPRVRSTFNKLYQALDSAGIDVADGKFELIKEDADDLHALWKCSGSVRGCQKGGALQSTSSILQDIARRLG